jgi:hypothetical protein
VDKDGNQVIYTEEELPEKWFFDGWFVFALFCPRGLSATRLSCLSEVGSDVPKQSRSETRAKEAKAGMDHRRTNEDGTIGLTAQDKVALASLQHAKFNEESKNIRDLIYYLTMEEGNQMKALEFVYNMIEGADIELEKSILQRRKNDVLQRINEVTDRKRKLEAESDSLPINQSTNVVGLRANRDLPGIPFSPPANFFDD